TTSGTRRGRSASPSQASTRRARTSRSAATGCGKGLGYKPLPEGGWLAKAGYNLDEVGAFLDDLKALAGPLGLTVVGIRHPTQQVLDLKSRIRSRITDRVTGLLVVVQGEGHVTGSEEGQGAVHDADAETTNPETNRRRDQGGVGPHGEYRCSLGATTLV